MITQNVNFGKRGQVKVQQMAFMLIALTILFVIAGLFVASITLSNLKEAREIANEKNAQTLVSKISNYPELSCENSFGRTRANCIDADKVFALMKTSQKDYKNFWGVSAIEIRKIYPENNITCTTDNYPNCGIIELFSDKNSGNDRSAFVSLCRKEGFHGAFYDKCELAKIMVRFEDVE